MKKSKAKEIEPDFFIKDHKEKVAGKKKPATKKGNKKVEEENKEESFNIDNEIVIGLTTKENKQNDKAKKDKPKKEEKKAKKRPMAKKEKKVTSKKSKIIKFTLLLFLAFGAIIFFLLSPIFNVKTITVKNNNNVNTQEIISLSGIETGENTFKILIGKAKKAIKENPYIEDVEINRILPGEIEIIIKERIPTYMLEFGDSFAYINNQGYILKITSEKIEAPIITGYKTLLQDIKTGSRLCVEDLKRLETVLKIMETINNYELGSLVTKIGIENKNNFCLYLEAEKKTVYLGNASNINMRIMYLKEIIIEEKGIESEIYIDGDMNKDNVYTREKV